MTNTFKHMCIMIERSKFCREYRIGLLEGWR